MTKAETAEIMAVISAAYPQFYDKQTEGDKIAAMRLWHRSFKNVSYEVMLDVVDMIIASNKFPPTIAEVNEKLDIVLGTGELTENEAWNMVRAAISKAIYYSSEEFYKMPEEVRAVIGDPSQLKHWALMDESTVNSVISSNFRRAYRAEAEKRRKEAYLPARRQAFLYERMKEIESRTAAALPSRSGIPAYELTEGANWDSAGEAAGADYYDF